MKNKNKECSEDSKFLNFDELRRKSSEKCLPEMNCLISYLESENLTEENTISDLVLT